jgi:hypothetical protein
MGHERLGFVPKTRRWQSLVRDLVRFAHNEVDVGSLASQTLSNVRGRFRDLPNDDGVNAAFSYILSLSFAGKSIGPSEFLGKIGVKSSVDSSPFQIAKDLSRWVDERKGSREYAELAKAAALDAISAWNSKVRTGHEDLFGKEVTEADIWRRASEGSGFCEISRMFFAKFTERYLAYFLEREASAKLVNPVDRDRLRSELHYHVNELSRHAFESAKITQSFAAGWFNKNTKEGFPTNRQVKGFLQYAFDKMSEELRRQEAQ